MQHLRRSAHSTHESGRLRARVLQRMHLDMEHAVQAVPFVPRGVFELVNGKGASKAPSNVGR